MLYSAAFADICNKKTMKESSVQERFMQLWTVAQPAVTGYINALVRDPAVAQDVLQETVLVLFRRFDDYDPSRPFLAWALGVARFQVLGVRRDQARCRIIFDSELMEQFTEQWAEASPASDWRAWALQECLGKLPARSSEMLRWRYFEELTADEIAARLKSKGPTIRVMLQRIRDQLRSCVERRILSEGRV